LYRIPGRRVRRWRGCRGVLGVLNDDIRTIGDVREMETFMHLRTEKNVFAWGQRLGEE
jgi:hypothetical protein